MEAIIRSRKEGGAPPQLSTKKSGPPLNLEHSSTSWTKKEDSSPQDFRGKRKELLSRRELHYLLVNRFSVLRKVKKPHSLPYGTETPPSPKTTSLSTNKKTPFSLSQGRELLTISSPLQHMEESLRSRRKDGALPNFKP